MRSMHLVHNNYESSDGIAKHAAKKKLTWKCQHHSPLSALLYILFIKNILIQLWINFFRRGSWHRATSELKVFHQKWRLNRWTIPSGWAHPLSCNFIFQLQGVKKHDIVRARAAWPNTGLTGANDLSLWAQRFNGAEECTGSLNMTFIDVMQHFRKRQDEAVDECSPGSVVYGLIQISQETAAAYSFWKDFNIFYVESGLRTENLK